jgi:hypothetical protein
MRVTAQDMTTLQNNEPQIINQIATVSGLSSTQITVTFSSISSNEFRITVQVSDGTPVSSAQGVRNIFNNPNPPSQLSVSGVNVTAVEMVPLSSEQPAPTPTFVSSPPSGLSTGVIVAIVVVCFVVCAAVVIIIIVVVMHKKKKGKAPKTKTTQPVTTQPTPQPAANQQQPKPREAESEKSSSGFISFDSFLV